MIELSTYWLGFFLGDQFVDVLEDSNSLNPERNTHENYRQNSTQGGEEELSIFVVFFFLFFLFLRSFKNESTETLPVLLALEAVGSLACCL